MVNLELSKQLQKIEDLFDKAQAFNSDAEIMSHWAKYLCVQCAGFLENSVVELYGNYVVNRSHKSVFNYVIAKLKRTRNPKTQTFIEITGMFDLAWRDNLEQYVGEGGRKEAIDAIMNHRHLIAHGSSSSITMARIRDYFDKSVEVINYIESQLN